MAILKVKIIMLNRFIYVFSLLTFVAGCNSTTENAVAGVGADQAVQSAGTDIVDSRFEEVPASVIEIFNGGMA